MRFKKFEFKFKFKQLKQTMILLKLSSCSNEVSYPTATLFEAEPTQVCSSSLEITPMKDTKIFDCVTRNQLQRLDSILT